MDPAKPEMVGPADWLGQAANVAEADGILWDEIARAERSDPAQTFDDSRLVAQVAVNRPEVDRRPARRDTQHWIPLRSRVATRVTRVTRLCWSNNAVELRPNDWSFGHFAGHCIGHGMVPSIGSYSVRLVRPRVLERH